MLRKIVYKFALNVHNYCVENCAISQNSFRDLSLRCKIYSPSLVGFDGLTSRVFADKLSKLQREDFVDNQWAEDRKRFENFVSSQGGRLLGEFINRDKLVRCCCSEGHCFSLRPSRVFVKENWCCLCRRSKGELKVEKSLSDLGIRFRTEFRLSQLPLRSYDFSFVYHGRRFLVEYDGVQHFSYGQFHDNYDDFLARREIDRLKTYVALHLGYFLIRIDYTQFDSIHEHIENALQESDKGKNFYYSSNRYEWLKNLQIPYSTLERECPRLL